MTGEISLRPYNPQGRSLAALRRIIVVRAGRREEREVTACRPVEGGYLMRLAGVATREAAALFTLGEVRVLRTSLPPLEPGGQQQQALDTTTKAADTATASALQQMQTAGQTGDQIYQTWGQDYAPLYGQIASEAAAKGGQADQDYQSMMARGDVAQAFANAQGQNERYMAQYGQSPISGVSQALNRSSGLNQGRLPW